MPGACRINSRDLNFVQMSDAEIARFIEREHSEFAEPFTAGRAAGILDAIQLGTTIERRSFGFAVIHPVGSQKQDERERLAPLKLGEQSLTNAVTRRTAVLWYLFISPSNRNPGIGRLFVEELRSQYGNETSIALLCHGVRRRSFFEKCGFRVANERNGDWYSMDNNW
jgi:GNAT superfamily N-acetyltransferase